MTDPTSAELDPDPSTEQIDHPGETADLDT